MGRLDPGQQLALRTAGLAWLVSRLMVWGAGLAAVLVDGPGEPPEPHLAEGTEPFGATGDKLVAPAARWDARWYVEIADDGYEQPLARAFYPLYPALSRLVGAPVGSSLIGGIVVSLAALLAALYLLHRLVSLELGEEDARRAVLLLAFFPASLFFSAVYTEALFLALGIGAVYAARLDRWALAGLLGALAAMTRPPGILLLVALVLLYLFGPGRERPARRRPRVSLGGLWLLLVPCGIAVHAAYLGIVHDDLFGAFGHQENWDRSLTFPLVTIWNSAVAAVEGVGDAFDGALPDNVYEFAFMCLMCVAPFALLRRVPVAYPAYLAVGVLLLLAYPIDGGPSGFSRQISVLFPLFMWLALVTRDRRAFRVVLVVFAVLMAVNAARFATWHYVA